MNEGRNFSFTISAICAGQCYVRIARKTQWPGLPILQALGLENVTTTNSDTGMSSKRIKYQSQVPLLNCFVTLSLKHESEERFPA